MSGEGRGDMGTLAIWHPPAVTCGTLIPAALGATLFEGAPCTPQKHTSQVLLQKTVKKPNDFAETPQQPGRNWSCGRKELS